MKYQIRQNEIKIYSANEFNPKHIFECGQVFAYKKIDEQTYIFYPNNQVFLVYKKDDFYTIKHIGGEGSVQDAIQLFDLDTDYSEIKKDIKRLLESEKFNFNKQIIEKSIDFGYGIRILKQDVFETIISFICSQNNHIKRITSSLDGIRRSLGTEIKLNLEGLEENSKYLENQRFYSFPSKEKLINQSEQFFIDMGLGYRAKYMVKALRQVSEINWKNLADADTAKLREILMNLSGVGRKVADCILLFGFSKKDVFPVDTWIQQAYNDLSAAENKNPLEISKILSLNFGGLSGYIQQYIYYFKREKRFG